MDAISLLNGRYSTPAGQLAEPAPTDAELTTMLRSAVAAPDHGGLRPWQFRIIRGEARERLGAVFAEAAHARDPALGEQALAAQAGKPLRAPLLIAVAARCEPDHPKIPESEQLLSAGAAAQQIQLTARALGYGAIWLTGPNAHDARVTEALGLGLGDRVIAFIYIGTERAPGAAPQRPDPWDFAAEWTEPQSHETL